MKVNFKLNSIFYNKNFLFIVGAFLSLYLPFSFLRRNQARIAEIYEIGNLATENIYQSLEDISSDGREQLGLLRNC